MTPATSPPATSSTSHDELVALLRELVRAGSENPPGDERAAVAVVARAVRGVGVEPLVMAREERRPNLVARVAGRGEAPPLLLHGHADVVPARAGEWRHDAFGAEVIDGELWGRGTLDMKGGVAMLLGAFLAAARAPEPPPGDLLLVVNADEETGGELGARFLVEEHADLLRGVRHALSEFGGYTHHVAGRRLYPVQVAQKRRCALRVTVHGPGGHAATPRPGGVAAQLAEVLSALARRRLPARVTPPVAAMVRTMAAGLPAGQRAALHLLLRPRATDGVLRLAGRAAEDLDPLFRDTAAATHVEAGDGPNVLPTQATVELDGRLLPGSTPDGLVAALRAILPRGAGVELVRTDPPPLRSQPDLSLLPMLEEILREEDPGGHPFPLVTAGMTDARIYDALGIQTYGFLPMRLPPGRMPALLHAVNERIPLDVLAPGARALSRAIERYPAALRT